MWDESGSERTEDRLPSMPQTPDTTSEAEPVGVLGTAGHIDHGKTALISALTGVDTDRLPEEKARGITIELGFAVLDLAGVGSLSIVDVPGHEGLVRTMVAGATGIDLVLLVVAADEGVMPQTREHIAICHLLGIERAVVALTKTDLVDDEMIELAAEEVRDLLAETTIANAPIIPVSARTRDGIAALENALSLAVHESGASAHRTGPPRLAVDRAFSMRGFGAVVTGTLAGSSLRVGDTVEIWPSGHKAKVRSLQSHGHARDQINGGSRCAANLQGIEVSELTRGDVVTHVDTLKPTQTADVAIQWLASAPKADGITSVELLSGTSERRARLAPIGGGDFVPGARSLARLHIDGLPLTVLPGDRFIVRGFARNPSAGATLGGGVVLDSAPPQRRRSDPDLIHELEKLEDGDLTTALRERISRSGYSGLDERILAQEMGRTREELAESLSFLEQQKSVVRAGRHTYLDQSSQNRLRDQLLKALEDFHAQAPMRPGVQRAALLGVLPPNVPTEIAEATLASMQADGIIALEGDQVRAKTHQPKIDEATQRLLDRLLADAQQAGLEPTAAREWAESINVTLERFRDLVAHLERQSLLVRAPGELWFDQAVVNKLKEEVVAYFHNHETIDTQAYKSLIGTTRRTAMPLMELLDELRVTRRQGDLRVLVKK